MAEPKRDDNQRSRCFIPRWQQISSETEITRIIAHHDDPKVRQLQQQHHQQPQQQPHQKYPTQQQSVVAVAGSLPDVVLALVFNGDLLTSQGLSPIESVINEAVLAIQQQQQSGDSSSSPSVDLSAIRPAFVEWKISKDSPFGNHLSSALLSFSASSSAAATQVVLAALLKGELLDKLSVDLVSNNETVLSSDRARRSQRADAKQNEQDAEVRGFVTKFLRHCFGKLRGAPTGPVTSKKEGSDGGALTIDINKMINMGKELLGKRSPQYAEKFFSRAVDTLEALMAESIRNLAGSDGGQRPSSAAIAKLQPELVASLADALAWRVLARFVCNSKDAPTTDGVQADGARILALLGAAHPEASALARQHTGIVLRAEALVRMSQAQQTSGSDGVSWIESECADAKLRKKLEQDPKDSGVRSLLVITLFLSGDMERCLTEAIKLATLNVPFGAVAVSAVTHFLGPNHELVKKL